MLYGRTQNVLSRSTIPQVHALCNAASACARVLFCSNAYARCLLEVIYLLCISPAYAECLFGTATANARSALPVQSKVFVHPDRAPTQGMAPVPAERRHRECSESLPAALWPAYHLPAPVPVRSCRRSSKVPGRDNSRRRRGVVRQSHMVGSAAFDSPLYSDPNKCLAEGGGVALSHPLCSQDVLRSRRRLFARRSRYNLRVHGGGFGSTLN